MSQYLKKKISNILAVNCTSYNGFKGYMKLLLMYIVKTLDSCIRPVLVYIKKQKIPKSIATKLQLYIILRLFFLAFYYRNGSASSLSLILCTF